MDELEKQLHKYCRRFSKESKSEIERAYKFALDKHNGQLRHSGEPYIIHPLNVAISLAKDGHDSISVISGLLHDTIEDTQTSQEELIDNFGKSVAKIVDGVTKISTLRIKDKSRLFADSLDDMFLERVDNYRKLMLATISDLRTIIIKLHDRLHNIKTIEYIPDQKKKFYARETIEIFAPIAERLGMGEMKGELEDFSFPYAYPKEYEKFIRSTKNVYKNPKKIISKVVPPVEKVLKENNIQVVAISSRAKHLYSLYSKFKRKNDISQIFDIVALRIIVNDVGDCYKTLGLIHSLYKPIPRRIFDYIARPKDSGYQSLHTTVKDSDNNIFEIQIRTQEMHHVAEFGAASHWSYKEQSDPKSANEWLKELKKIEKIQSGKELIQTIKEELFSERVFVFTPYGDIIDLPVGSCGIDFAYRIHTDLGNKCRGVKINGRLMPLKAPLETGDVIEILKSKSAEPTKDWLSFAKTAVARNKIGHFLREKNQEQFSDIGKEIVELEIEKNSLPKIDQETMQRFLRTSTLPFKDMSSVFAAVGQKQVSKIRLLKVLYPAHFKDETRKIKSRTAEKNEVFSLRGIRHVFSNCCKPSLKDDLIGYLSREHIIKIHKKDCKRILNTDPNRIISV